MQRLSNPWIMGGRFLGLVGCGITALAAAAAAAAGPDWRQQLAMAEAGATVAVPAGRFTVADLPVPAGVTLAGAGSLETILDAAGGASGLIAGPGSVIRGLTVRSASGSGILVREAADVTVSAVRVEKCMTGIVAQQATRLRIENSILYANRTGLAVSGGAESCFVNNTLFNNSALGLSLIGTRDLAVFNTVIANSSTGIYAADNEGLHVDHNLYLANYIGKIPGHPPTITPQGWRDLTGLDAHSLQQPIAFADPDAGRFEPTTRLAWSPDRAPTAGFGAAVLAGRHAPVTDALGRSRPARPGLGAIELAADSVPPPAGRFRVRQDDAAVSAGLFTKDGVLVNHLFHHLPLAAGEHPFWLPARDWQGRPIPAGDYEVRVAESRARMAYRGLVFNTAPTSRKADHAPLEMHWAAFLPEGDLVLGCDWSESALQLRRIDPATGRAVWTVAGALPMHGMCLDGAGHVYSLRQASKDKDSGRVALELLKVRLDDGAVLPVTADKPAPLFDGAFSESADGMAALGDRLYVADPAAGKVLHTPAAAPTFSESFACESPRQIVADAEHELLWLISGDRRLVAVDPAGKIVHTRDFPHAIHKLAAGSGRLAVVSRETGKVEVFTIESGPQLRAGPVLGTGGPPTGRFDSRKFTFALGHPCGAALAADGRLFVLDCPRTMLIDPQGNVGRETIAVWGQHLVSGELAGDDQPRWWNVDASYSMTMNSRQGTWAPDGIWTYAAQPGFNRWRTAIGFFTDAGRNFALFRQGNWERPSLMLVEFDKDYRGRMVAEWRYPKSTKYTLVACHDTNGDGIIDEADSEGQPVVDTAGVPVPFSLPGDAFLDETTHDLLVPGGVFGPASIGRRIRYAGLDGKGIPSFAWATAETLHCRMDGEGSATFMSPFDLATTETINTKVGEFHAFSDGTVAFSMNTKTGGGSGMGHVAGSDMAAAGPDGRFRWFHPLPRTAGVHGVQVAHDILITQDFTDMDWHLMNKDGLGLGICGVPQEMHWTGMWNDHPRQYRLFTGNDGEVYAVLGDYMVTGFHLFKLEGRETVAAHAVPVRIDTAEAGRLAALPPQPVPARVEPPRFEVLVRKLPAPLPIDGDLAKWRKAGVTPQILVTPETAGGGITGPEDLSGVVRLAHENGNLYVQVIKFDDVATMHQPLAKHYLQDSVECCINGFLHGFKFNVTRTQEHGDTVFRDRFYHKEFNRVFTPAEVPRSIRVLDNAAEVEERRLIESIYGCDLAQSRVIVTEFKLPLSLAFEGDAKAGPTGTSGDTMWIGFMLDDNDTPGSDVQDLLVYPATYSTFALKELGCLATFE
jgi:hypothetical protein